MPVIQTLEPGILLRRYKRFLADVQLLSGEVIVVHCPNPGSMIGCAEPGSPVWLRKSSDPKRRLTYTWVVTSWRDNLISVDTLLANKLVHEIIEARTIAAFNEYQVAVREYTHEDSRFDFCLFRDSSRTAPGCLLEVKSTTLVDGDVAMFPDAKTERGRKHLHGLMRARSAGYRAVQFYCVSRNDVSMFRPAEHIDPKYAESLRQAHANGVEIMAWATEITGLNGNFAARLAREIPVELD